MAVLILRAWSDTASRGQYSILHDDNCVTLIPIPDPMVNNPPCFLRAECIASPCTGKPLSTYIVSGSRVLHNDPRLDLGFLTDHWQPRGRIPRGLRPGDLVLFVAGLSPEPATATRLRKLVESGLAGIYIVAGLVVKKIVDVATIGWEKAVKTQPELVQSPHYWREARDKPVALIGETFMVNPPLRANRAGTLAKPSRELEAIMGTQYAYSFARGRFRRSRLIDIEAPVVIETITSMGHSLSKPTPQKCICMD